MNRCNDPFNSAVEKADLVSPWLIYRALVGIGIGCALLIVSVFVLTGPVIAENRAQAIEQAVLEVLPNAITKKAFAFSEQQRFEPLDEISGNTESSANSIFYAGFNDKKELVGIAILAEGRGYQDVIRIIYGYSPESQSIIGMKVLESRETPGLGDKIETDWNFTANFKSLDVALNLNGDGLANKIVAVRQGEKSQPWQIDGITGATISSQAIAKMLDKSTAIWLPRIQQQRAVFETDAMEQVHD